MVRALPPAEILLHAHEDEPPPHAWLPVTGQRALHRAGEVGGCRRVEHEARRCSVLERGLGRIDHRVGETARAADQRHGTVAQAVDLIESARFVARGHDEDIRPCFDLVRQRFVVSDTRTDVSRIAIHGDAQSRLERLLAAAEDDDLQFLAHQLRQGIEHEIETLLFHQAPDEAEQRHVGPRRQGEGALQRGLVHRLVLQCMGVVGARDGAIARRIPLAVIGAVEDADQIIRAMLQQHLQTAAELGRADLAGVIRAHRVDHVRVRDPALDERGLAVEFQAVHGPQTGGQTELLEHVVGEQSLIGEVVYGEHGGRPRRGGGEQRRHESALPVVAVHDIGAPVDSGAIEGHRLDRAAEHGKARGVVGPLHALAIRIGPAVPVEMRRRVDQPHRHPRAGEFALEQTHRIRKAGQAQFGNGRQGAGLFDRLAIGRHDDAHVAAQRLQCRRQTA